MLISVKVLLLVLSAVLVTILIVGGFVLWKLAQLRLVMRNALLAPSTIPDYMVRLKRSSRIAAGIVAAVLILCIVLLLAYREPIRQDFRRLRESVVRLLQPPDISLPVEPARTTLVEQKEKLIAVKDQVIANQQALIAELKQKSERPVSAIGSTPPPAALTAPRKIIRLEPAEDPRQPEKKKGGTKPPAQPRKTVVVCVTLPEHLKEELKQTGFIK